MAAGAFIYRDISLALKQPNLRVPSFYDKNSNLIVLLIALQEHPAPFFEIPVSLYKQTSLLKDCEQMFKERVKEECGESG